MFPIRYEWQLYERWNDCQIEEFYFCCEECYDIFKQEENLDPMEVD